MPQLPLVSLKEMLSVATLTLTLASMSRNNQLPVKDQVSFYKNLYLDMPNLVNVCCKVWGIL